MSSAENHPEPTGPAESEHPRPRWEDSVATVCAERYRIEWTRDNCRLIVDETDLLAALDRLKSLGFDMLVDLAGIDYLDYPEATRRFGIVYALLSIDRGDRVFVKTHVDLPDPSLPSVVGLWQSADWMEREVFDMFGVSFIGHPDLRRILMPEEFTSFPLRKDYPLRGRGERHNFPVITRAES